MTWKSHCLANGAVAFALTHHPEVAAAAMLTATLPDQLEAYLPLGRHRGATHWLLLWLAVMFLLPFYVQRELSEPFTLLINHAGRFWSTRPFLLGTCLFGLALGPFLHVLLDGCSDSGVPVAPFSRQRLKLGMYRTYSQRWRWDLSELLFLCVLFGFCAFFWRIRI